MPVSKADVADAGETVTISVSVEVQKPPLVADTSVVLLPAHIDIVPVRAAGAFTTVTTAVVIQPATLYVIRAVPAELPKNAPAIVPGLATPTVLLAHVPPVVSLANIAV